MEGEREERREEGGERERLILIQHIMGCDKVTLETLASGFWKRTFRPSWKCSQMGEERRVRRETGASTGCFH
jgi:hypothetical protein